VRGISSHFVWLNRSKESLTLNLKRRGSQAGAASPARERRMFSCRIWRPEPPSGSASARRELRKKYPRLIVCDLSGYGSSGPYRDKKAYDMLIQAEPA
jgi:itaconate CoA-transferase